MSQLRNIFLEILKVRGLDKPEVIQAFLYPKYDSLADPMLLPDVDKAVKRIIKAKQDQESIVIYGDYDIDGLSATALLFEALSLFGLNVSTFIPSRFEEGYGLSIKAIDHLSEKNPKLLITVDCGSTSVDEVAYAKEKGIDIIITDHHSMPKVLPDAVALINPKRLDHNYPFRDFSGVGVAFNLVRALQIKLPGLEKGQEKWLLDLVALGTVCDIVSLTSENRILTHWGLTVMKKTRRTGLKALMAVADINQPKLSAKHLGFGLGPRLNASGRLETAHTSLELLLTRDHNEALNKAQILHDMNRGRQSQQKKILAEAKKQAEKYSSDPVLVVSHPEWSHGIIGIVAAKLLKTYHKPTFVLQELGDESKGSARSFGNFSLNEAIQKNKELLLSGGGHDAAAGISMLTKKIASFREAINDYYRLQGLKNHFDFLKPKADIYLDSFDGLDEALVEQITSLEPFGNDNPQPIFCINNLQVIGVRSMGSEKQHVKLKLSDSKGQILEFLAFNAPKHFFAEPGDNVTVWCTFDINEWQGKRSVEGRFLEIKNNALA